VGLLGDLADGLGAWRSRIWVAEFAITARPRSVARTSSASWVTATSAAHAFREDLASRYKNFGQITSQLPSITGLTTETGLAVGTVRRTINILVKEGLAQTVPGRGTFVRS
jgi:hypothetical protein